MRILWLSALAATLATQTAAQPLVFSPDRAARIDEAMNRYVADGSIAGAVTLVLQNGRTVHQGAYGWADKPAGRRMAFDAIFRIASQSKAITSTAVMMLVEEGRIGLGDPVSRYLPSFARTTVAEAADTGRRIVPGRRPITIRDLLTHTAGISYGTDRLVAPLYQAAGLGPAAGWGWYTADKDEPICTTIDRLATLPFVAQPGERWVYGYNTDVLGCLVERVSGTPLDEFVRTRIFEPLGMRDTYFFLPRDKAGRLAAVHRRDSTGALVLAPAGARGQGHYVEGPRRSFAGGAGLVSTAADYGRFLQMLLDGGAAPDGARLLSPTTVRLMTTNQVDTLFTAEGYGFGLGFQITERPGAGGSPATEGTFGWGGAYQSSYSVDPALGLVTIILTQHLPNVPFNVGGRFTALVYQALVPADPR
ncbi:MAG: serine hydrolase domain-containing protein [Gemmatimonadales bacterium]